jgi:hypothetical protein
MLDGGLINTENCGQAGMRDSSLSASRDLGLAASFNFQIKTVAQYG